MSENAFLSFRLTDEFIKEIDFRRAESLDADHKKRFLKYFKNNKHRVVQILANELALVTQMNPANTRFKISPHDEFSSRLNELHAEYCVKKLAGLFSVEIIQYVFHEFLASMYDELSQPRWNVNRVRSELNEELASLWVKNPVEKKRKL